MSEPYSSAIKITRGREGSPPRHRGRILALQVLFECDLTGHDWEYSLANHADAIRARPAVKAFASECLAGVASTHSDIDSAIQRHAPLWPIEQLSAVDRNVLRLALYELREESETPARVAINEAVELAKEFGGETSARFVNGVLGASVGDPRQDIQ